MNLPNKLTLGRLVLCAAFVIAMSVTFPFAYTVALWIFILASITDYLDGQIARRHNLITDFGKLMDPLADKILSASAFILLIPLGAIPAWATIAIISREFLITGLRTLAGSKGIILPAEKIGKHKTVWQMLTIIYFLLLLSLGEFGLDGQTWWTTAYGLGQTVLVGITVLLTVYSGLAYLVKNHSVISEK